MGRKTGDPTGLSPKSQESRAATWPPISRAGMPALLSLDLGINFGSGVTLSPDFGLIIVEPTLTDMPRTTAQKKPRFANLTQIQSAQEPKVLENERTEPDTPVSDVSGTESADA